MEQIQLLLQVPSWIWCYIWCLVNALTTGTGQRSMAIYPYVNTVRFHNSSFNVAGSAAQASALNINAYAAYNGGLVAARTNGFYIGWKISNNYFSAGANGLVMVDECLTPVNVPLAGLVLPCFVQTNRDYVFYHQVVLVHRLFTSR
jgi:hypothetical protein